MPKLSRHKPEVGELWQPEIDRPYADRYAKVTFLITSSHNQYRSPGITAKNLTPSSKRYLEEYEIILCDSGYDNFWTKIS